VLLESCWDGRHTYTHIRSHSRVTLSHAHAHAHAQTGTTAVSSVPHLLTQATGQLRPSPSLRSVDLLDCEKAGVVNDGTLGHGRKQTSLRESSVMSNLRARVQAMHRRPLRTARPRVASLACQLIIQRRWRRLTRPASRPLPTATRAPFRQVERK